MERAAHRREGISRDLAGEGLEHGEAERELIAQCRRRCTRLDLGGKVTRCAGGPGADAEASVPDGGRTHRGPSEAKVAERSSAGTAHEHVLGLDVAMDEASRVRGREPTRHLEQEIHDRLPSGQLRCARRPRSQRLAFDELHRDEHITVGEAGVVAGHHARGGHAGERLCLEQQAVACRGLERMTVDDLDGHRAIEQRIVAPEHHAHRAGPERLAEHVASDRRRRQRRHRSAPAHELRAHAAARRAGTQVLGELTAERVVGRAFSERGQLVRFRA